ncbi:MAG TPA: hypothetical protein VN026_10150 [Bacteroidia bacterium]|jgi:hypothetical protein|nr:hypothetical protein [Bacteroidia bacterium]
MKKTIVISLLIIIIIIACNQTKDESVSTAKLIANNDPNPAMNHPDSVAWQLFIMVNSPANPNNPKGNTTWENWALARDVYANPNKKPIWDSVTKSSKSLEDLETLPLQQLARLQVQNQLAKKNVKPHGPFNIFIVPDELNDSVSLDETRMNRTVFDFITNNDLYNAEGQEEYFNQNKKIDLPIDAKEVKAIWIKIKDSDTSYYHYHSFEKVNSKTKKKEIQYWGLVSLHIISKDMPQWTWATFENRKNFRLPDVEKDPNTKSKDFYGITPDGKISTALSNDLKNHNMPLKWQNYILRGTQTAYTDFKGKPTLLANTYTEDGFVKSSSCITCHSKATIGAKLDFKELPKEIQDTIKYGKNKKKVLKAANFVNRLPIFKVDTKDTTIADNGIPNPEWYADKNGKMTYLQTDFMWSFFRAKRKQPYQVKK